MVIRIIDLVSGADTTSQGMCVFAQIRDAVQNDDGVTVSFDGVQTATSSFVNAAFVPLLSDYSLDRIKRQLRVVKSTRQINHMIKTRLEREAAVAVRQVVIQGPALIHPAT